MEKKRGEPLPKLTTVKGLQLKGAFNLLDAEQRRKLDDALEEDAKTRSRLRRIQQLCASANGSRRMGAAGSGSRPGSELAGGLGRTCRRVQTCAG